VFTARYGLIPYMKQIVFRLLKVNLVQGTMQCQVVLSTVMQVQLHKAEVSFTLEQNVTAQRGVEV
jgi:uncharacterized membrane protein